MAGIEAVAVVGAGAWGTALALAAARAGRRVVLYARDPKVVASIASRRPHPRFLDIPLDPAIRASGALEDALAADALLLAVPAQTLRAGCRELSGPGAPLVICAKGLESAGGVFLSEVAAEECPGRALAALSGPNFAAEIARGLPAATTLGCADAKLGRRVAEALSGPGFRVYWTDDLIGVEIGGALKNVLAIAAGMVAGRGLGENARAAIITRGLAELSRLGEALGARRETLTGLSGLGDLILSAGSLTSRNMAFGHAIGRGADPKELRAHPGALVEGTFTAGAAVRLAARHGVDRGRDRNVDAILEGRMTLDAALEALMSRPLRTETEVPRPGQR